MTAENIKSVLTADDKTVLVAYADGAMRTRTAARNTNFSEHAIHVRLSKVYRKTLLDPRSFRELAVLIHLIEGGENNDDSR